MSLFSRRRRQKIAFGSFNQSHLHEPTPEGMSPQPIHQFLTEVETILLENDLI